MVQNKIPKPAVVMFDISGTVARESLTEKILIPYFQKWHRNFLETKWDTQECQKDVQALFKVASDEGDGKKSSKRSNSDKKTTIDAISKYVDACGKGEKKEGKALQVFRFHVWFDGYDNNRIATPVYSDVAVTVQKWQLDQKIKLFVLSNGWSEATKKFMTKTSHGDLNMLIEDYFDNSVGSLVNSDTFAKVVEQKIKEKPENVCFLTKSADEAKAAKKAGLNAILVCTHRNQIEDAANNCKEIPIARSFTEIEFI